MVTSIIDWQLTVERLNGNEKAAREIIPLFLKELPTSQRLINQAYDANNAKKLYEHLHRLHGGCCYVGVPVLKDITLRFCDAAKHNRHQEFTGLLAEFNQTVDAILLAAKDFVLP